MCELKVADISPKDGEGTVCKGENRHTHFCLCVCLSFAFADN